MFSFDFYYSILSIIPREVPGTDVSSSVETDKENDSNMASDDEKNTTDQLLDSTYHLNPVHSLNAKSPGKVSLKVLGY